MKRNSELNSQGFEAGNHIVLQVYTPVVIYPTPAKQVEQARARALWPSTVTPTPAGYGAYDFDATAGATYLTDKWDGWMYARTTHTAPRLWKTLPYFPGGPTP